MKSNISYSNLIPFSAKFLSNGFWQCMDIYLYWEKPDWLCCQYWIMPNIAASTKNRRISRNHEKSSYQTNSRVFIIAVFTFFSMASFDACLHQNALSLILNSCTYLPKIKYFPKKFNIFFAFMLCNFFGANAKIFFKFFKF